MAQRISRHQLAKATAASLKAGDQSAIARLAAYLVDHGRQSEADLVIRDVEQALVEHGIVLADVTSARALSDKTRRHISDFIKDKSGASQIVLREKIDPDVIGGIRLVFAGKLLDATVATKLERLA